MLPLLGSLCCCLGRWAGRRKASLEAELLTLPFAIFVGFPSDAAGASGSPKKALGPDSSSVSFLLHKLGLNLLYVWRKGSGEKQILKMIDRGYPDCNALKYPDNWRVFFFNCSCSFCFPSPPLGFLILLPFSAHYMHFSTRWKCLYSFNASTCTGREKSELGPKWPYGLSESSASAVQCPIRSHCGKKEGPYGDVFMFSGHNVIFHSHGWAQSSGFHIQVYVAVTPGGLMNMALLGLSAPSLPGLPDEACAELL